MLGLTTLGRTEVLAGGRGTGTGTASLLDAESTAVNLLSLETLLGSISLVGGDHLDEAEAAGLLGVGVTHDLTLLNLAILLEEARDFRLGQARVDASDKKVGARVDGAIVITALGSSIVVLHSARRRKDVA